DDVSRELLGREPNQSACCGTHRLVSLAVMLRVDADTPVLSDAVRWQVREVLRETAQTLAACQDESGSWDATWFQHLRGAPPLNSNQIVQGDIGRLVVTGHHLEWLMLLPEDLQPSAEVFTSGAHWLHKVLMASSSDPEWVAANYCPVIHAARSI